MTMNRFLFLVILLISLGACKSDNQQQTKKKEAERVDLVSADQLYGTWKISEVDTFYFADGQIDPDELEKEIKKERAKYKSKGKIYSFFPENKASVVYGKKYQGADWKLSDGKLLFNRKKEGLNQASTEIFKNIKTYTKVGYPFFIAEIEGKGVFQFRQIGSTLKNPNEDAYHPINNQWRVTATKSETYKEMRQRLYNYTQHCHYLFKASLERDMKKVFTGNTAAIYRYYDGAIELVDGGKIPSEWIANYYSPDEALDAWAMAKTYFKGNMIRKKNEGGYVIANEIIFRELLEKIKKDL